MKTLVGIVAVLIATTSSGSAGQPECELPLSPQAEERFQEVSARLSLTPEQAKQVRPVLTGMLGILKAVRDDYGAAGQSGSSRRRMNRELRAIRSHADERFKRILSRAQMEGLRAIRREWRSD